MTVYDGIMFHLRGILGQDLSRSRNVRAGRQSLA